MYKNPFEPNIFLDHKYNRSNVSKVVLFHIKESRELKISIIDEVTKEHQFVILSYDDHHVLAEFLKENDVWK